CAPNLYGSNYAMDYW
nr:immunoglobulin heavy chain junction region [Mus musculus]